MTSKNYLVYSGITSITIFLSIVGWIILTDVRRPTHTIGNTVQGVYQLYGKAYFGYGSCKMGEKRGVRPFTGKLIFMKRGDVTNLVNTLDSRSKEIQEAYQDQLSVGLEKIKALSAFTFSQQGAYSIELPFGDYIVTPEIDTYVNQEVVFSKEGMGKKLDLNFFECR